MHAHRIHDGEERTWAVIMEAGDELMSRLGEFAATEGLGGSRVSAIGAFERAELGFYDLEAQDYRRTAIDRQCEVLSLMGDIARDEEDRPKLHLHVVLGLDDATTRGGHLLAATVRPTLEVLVVESPRHLVRRFDPASGLPLIDHAQRAR